MRRLVVMLSLACWLLGVLSGLRAQEAQQGKNEEDNGYSQISIFAKTIELIRQDYVDGSKTSYHDLITAAMKGMLCRLIRIASSWIRMISATCKRTRAAVLTVSA